MNYSCEDLEACRNRLDASVEENRRNRRVIEEVNQKIQEYRNRRASHSIPDIHGAIVTFEPRNVTSIFKSSPTLSNDFDPIPIEKLLLKFKEELQRNQSLEELLVMVQGEANSANNTNERLRQDIHELTAALERSHSAHQHERRERLLDQQRYRNRNVAVTKQLAAVWRVVSSYRQQMSELHSMTREELGRHGREMGESSFLLLSSIREFLLKQEIRRRNEGTRDSEKEKREKDEEEHVQLIINAYQAQIEKNLQIEREKAQDAQRMNQLLQKAEEDKKQLHQDIQYIFDLTNMASTTKRHRTRSESPGRSSLGEAHSRIRTVLNEKNDEIRQLEMKLEEVRREKERNVEDKKNIQREIDNARRELTQSQHSNKQLIRENDELSRKINKLTEKEVALEDEKKVLLDDIHSLRDTINQNHRKHTAFIEQLSGEHKAEMDSRMSRIHNEMDEEINNIRLKMEKVTEQLETEKVQSSNKKLQLREANAQLNLIQRQHEEYAAKIAELEVENAKIKEELEKQTEQKTEEDRARRQTDREIMQLNEQKKELSTELIQMRTENTQLQLDIEDLHSQMETLKRKLQSQIEENMSIDQAHTETEKKLVLAEETIQSHEQTIQEIRGNMTSLQEQLNSRLKGTQLQLDNLKDIHQKAIRTIEEKNRELSETIKENHKQNEQLRNLSQEKEEIEGQLREQKTLLQQAQMTITHTTQQKETLAEQIRTLQRTHDEHVQEQKERESHWEEDVRESIQEVHRAKEQTELAIKQKDEIQQQCELFTQKMEDLEDLHEKLLKEYDDEKGRSEELAQKMKKLEGERNREREEFIQQNREDREEFERERHLIEKNRQQAINEIKGEMERMEEALEQRQQRINELAGEYEEANEEREVLRGTIAKLREEFDEQRISLEDLQATHARDRAILSNDVEEQRLEKTKMTAQIERLTRQIQHAQQQHEQLTHSLKTKSSSLDSTERTLNEIVLRLREHEEKEDALRDRVAVVEAEREHWRTKCAQNEHVQRQFEAAEKQARDLQTALHAMQDEITQKERLFNKKIEQSSAVTIKMREYEGELEEMRKRISDYRQKIQQLEEHNIIIKEESQKNRTQVNQLTQLNANLKRTYDELKQHMVISHENKDSKQRTELRLYKEVEEECKRLREELAHFRENLEKSQAKIIRLEEQIAITEGEKERLIRELREERRRRANVFSSTIDGATSSAPPISPPIRPFASTTHLYTSDNDLRGSDTTLTFLKERIHHLEQDKSSLLNKLTQLNDMLSVAKNESSSLAKRVEGLEEDKKHLELRLHSQRQMYLSNEEAMSAREKEGRTLRGKLAQTEFRIREREAYVQQITSEMNAMKKQIEELSKDREALVENQLTHKNSEAERIRSIQLKEQQIIEARKDTQVIRQKMEELDGECANRGRIIEKLMRQLDQEKELVLRLRADGEHWKNKAEAVRATMDGHQKNLVDNRINALRREYHALSEKHDNTLSEQERIRSELRQTNHNLEQATYKITELERALEQEKKETNALHVKIVAYEKNIAELKRREHEMGDELAILRKDNLRLTADGEDQKRRLTTMDIHRKELDINNGRMQREVIILKKYIEELEDEKNRREKALKETMTERRAIDKSLATMEKENAELYRSCSLLQTQILQLERENGRKDSRAQRVCPV